ncbi:MAG: hypothetical protein ACREQP_14170 [Candidatus Binatia bacterium]
MRRVQAVVLFSLFLGLSPSCRKFEVRISSPEEEATVAEQLVVQGNVSDARAAVWVVVLNLDVPGEYWVQPQATVKADGTWTAEVYVGEPGEGDKGKRFLLMAIANPKQPLQSGDVLGGWPPAAAQSNILEVTRK